MQKISENIRVVSLHLLDASFPVAPEDENATKQRFMTLFEHESHTRHGGSASVARVTNLYGETFALKRLHVAAICEDEANRSDNASRPSEAKVLRSSYGSDGGRAGLGSGTPDYVTQGHVSALYEEYRVHQAVSHLRGYPKLYGFGMCGNDPVILMEWVAGISLHDALEEHGAPLPLVALADFGIAVLSLLERAMELDETFVHRDLSPRNILLRTDRLSYEQQLREGTFDLCLVDFGSSSLNVEGETDPTFTRQRNIWRMGTPSYAPPEMLSPDIELPPSWRQSQTIDTYALCSILYELYAGHKPYHITSGDNRSPYRMKTEGPPNALVPRQPDGGALASIIMTGLSAQQDDRPSVKQLKAALENWKRLPSQRTIGGLHGAKPADAAFWQPGYARRAVTRRTLIACGIVTAGAVAAGAIAWPKLARPTETFDPGRYEATTQRYNGPALYKALDGQHPGWMLCSEKGEVVCKPVSSRECGPLREGLVALYDDVSQRYGYITPFDNSNGYAWGILPRFAQADDFSEGLAAVQDRESRLWGYIDAGGNWALPPQYLSARRFSHGVAAVQAAEGETLWGAVNRAGAWLAKPSFAALGTHSASGCAVAQKLDGDASGPWSIVDLHGNATSASRFEKLRSCAEGPAPALDAESGLWGFVAEGGEWVIPPVFLDARPFRLREPLGTVTDAQGEAFAAVQDPSTQLWYFVDQHGAPANGMKPRFWKLGDLHDYLAPAQASDSDSTVIVDDADTPSRVRGAGRRYGYVDATGEWHLKRQVTLVDTSIGAPGI